MGMFYACGAAAGVLGGPLSGNLLQLDGWHGVAGWQWVFLIEGIPALMLVVACPMLLRDKVADGHFLSDTERAWLADTLEAENRQKTGHSLTLMQALASPVVVAMIVAYTFIGIGVYGKNFFLPLMIKGMAFSDLNVGYLSALPSVAGCIGMILLSRSSDRTGSGFGTSPAPV